jgi:8-oxo-dGTP pyrophosphatase MutT (NUDIX family)
MGKEKLFFVGVKGVITDGKKILLLKDASKPDFWDVPGGRIDGEEFLHETLLRELYEELPSIQDVRIGELITVYRVPGSIKDSLGLVLVFFEVQASFPNGIELSAEHTQYEWVPFEDALNKGSEAVESVVKRITQKKS